MSIPAFLPGSTVKALVKKDLSAAVKSWGPYVAAAVSFLASSLVLKNYLSGLGDNNILITSDPLNFPLYISLVVVSFYLAILSAVSISSEKDRGTLEVLFYGPVNNGSYLLSKYLADMTIFLFLIGLLIPYFIFASLLTNLALSWSLVKGIVLSVFSASCIISFSLLISTATSKMRNSVIWMVALLGAFLSIQLAGGILLRLNESALSLLVQYLRMTINVMNAGLEWVTPFAPLNKGVQAIVIGNDRLYLGSILFALLYSSFFLAAAVAMLRKKGVQA
jgi:ABC-type transport system involved in multi-copper enzyme maturation permease subunit